jgi:carbonic anhydrase
MKHFSSPRRGFLKVAGATAAFAVGGCDELVAAPEQSESESPKTPAEAIAMLKAGNARFVAGKSTRIPVTPEALAKSEKGQHPFATILGCSDSRVPIELIFDQGLGDLFVIRLAGNVVDTDVEGSIEYAVAHLKTKLIVVLGHEGCGAVTAAMAAKDEREKEPVGIRKLVQQIEPALEGINPDLPQSERLQLGVEANVRQSVKEILAFPGHNEARKKGLFDIVGSVYELHTGRVRLVDVAKRNTKSD